MGQAPGSKDQAPSRRSTISPFWTISLDSLRGTLVSIRNIAYRREGRAWRARPYKKSVFRELLQRRLRPGYQRNPTVTGKYIVLSASAGKKSMLLALL